MHHAMKTLTHISIERSMVLRVTKFIVFQIVSMAEEGEIIDINVATVKELETLFGVGRAKAEAIFSSRMVSYS